MVFGMAYQICYNPTLQLPPPDQKVLKQVAAAAFETIQGQLIRDAEMKNPIKWHQLQDVDQDDWMEVAIAAYGVLATHAGAHIKKITNGPKPPK
jgi:hypothetical protein